MSTRILTYAEQLEAVAQSITYHDREAAAYRAKRARILAAAVRDGGCSLRVLSAWSGLDKGTISRAVSPILGPRHVARAPETM